MPHSPVSSAYAGSATATVAAGAGTTVIKAAPGRLCRILVTTVGSANAVTFYDNASTNSGTVIGVVPGSASFPAGTVIEFQMPAVNGITAVGAANSPALTVSYA